MPEKFTSWDVTEFLDTEKRVCFYLEAAAEEDTGDGELIRLALNDILRAKNLGRLNIDIKANGEGVYELLCGNSSINSNTITRITDALGIQPRIAA